MGLGELALLGSALGFMVLILLVLRRMLRGDIHEGARIDDAEANDLAAEIDRGEDDEDAPKETAEPREPPVPADSSGPGGSPRAPLEDRPMERGLEKTRKGFMARLNELLFKGSFDEKLAEELESLMVTSDIGIRTTERLLAELKAQLSRKEIRDADSVRSRLKAKIVEIVHKEIPPIDWTKKPTVVMVIGVNGVGKTTTIGKLASRLTKDGKKVVLAAGDTFRAAAVEQLEVWATRSGAEIVKGHEKQDPASVIFDAITRAKTIGADACICDTAGRLHTKVNLMEELKKLRRVMEKAMPGAPHEVLMVLDATTGQNGIAQAKQFEEAVEVDSIALTKLDGTAKGGVVVAICDDLSLPVRFVGIGEKIEDLRDFDAKEFVDALFAG
jgi:fused signal recognition particle receptor